MDEEGQGVLLGQNETAWALPCRVHHNFIVQWWGRVMLRTCEAMEGCVVQQRDGQTPGSLGDCTGGVGRSRFR